MKTCALFDYCRAEKKIGEVKLIQKIVIALLFTALFCFKKLSCEEIDVNPFRKNTSPEFVFIRVFLRSKVSPDFLKYMFILHVMLGSAGEKGEKSVGSVQCGAVSTPSS